MSLDATSQDPNVQNTKEFTEPISTPQSSTIPSDSSTSQPVSEPDDVKRPPSGSGLSVSSLMTGPSSTVTTNKAPIIRKPVTRHVIVAPPKPARTIPEPIIPVVPSLPTRVYSSPYPPTPILPQPVITPTTHSKSKPRGRSNEMPIPEPMYFRNATQGEYGLRCVCGESFVNVGLIQCDKCEFWLHSMCMNIPRKGSKTSFICPFCAERKIRCQCGKNMKYDEPLIQCMKCRNWSHKSCEHLEFGANPQFFLCKRCGGTPEYELKYVTFDKDESLVSDDFITPDCDRSQLLGSLPDGPFKTLVLDDLDRTQLSPRETITKYFHAFAPLLFDRAHEFWRVFCDVLSSMLNLDRSTILAAIDSLAKKLLYQKPQPPHGFEEVTGLKNSEAIEEFLGKLQIPRLETTPPTIPIMLNPDGRVVTPVPIDDGAFICDVPGFLVHTDEIPTDDGIPLNCLLITDNELVVDTEGGSFPFASALRRSFHFNTIVKLVRISGTLHVALFAVRMKGPLGEDKTKRGPAIPAGGEIILPLDGDIPYPVRKCEWKDRKQRARVPPPEKRVKPRRRQEPVVAPKSEYAHPDLTLLSAFYDESVPPMPFILLPNEDAVEQYRIQMEIRTRTRPRGRRPVD